MRKPLAATGFSFFLTLFALGFFGYNVALSAGIFLAAAFLIILFIRPLRSSGLPFAVFAALGACFLFCFSILMSVRPAERLDKMTARVQVDVTDFNRDFGGYSYRIKTCRIAANDCPQNVSAVLFTRKRINCRAGDTIDTEMYFEKIDGQTREYYYPDGIYLRAYLGGGSVGVTAPEHRPYYYYTAKIRNYIEQFVDKYSGGDTSGIIKGIVMSQKAGISNELYSNVKICGVSHILAVSGMHAGIIGSIFIALFGLFGLNRRLSAAVSTLFVWAFIAVAGFPFSAMRAGIMFTVFALSQMIFRKADPLNSLALALLVITVLHPFAAMDIGLLSSASSCAGLIVLSRPIQSRLEKRFITDRSKQRVRFYVISTLSATAAALIGLAPCSVIYYRSFSLVAAAANLLILPFLLPVLLFTMAGAVLFLIPGVRIVAAGFLFVAALSAKFIIIVINLLAQIPFASISLYRGYFQLCLGASFIIFALIFAKNALFTQKKLCHIRIGVLLCAVLFVFGASSFYILNRGVTELYIVGAENECAVLIHGGRHNALIALSGNGQNYEVLGTAKALGITGFDTIIVADDGRGQRLYKKPKRPIGCKQLILPAGHTAEEVCGGSPEVSQLVSTELELFDGCSVKIDTVRCCFIIKIGQTEIVAAANGCSLDKLQGVCYNAFIGENLPSGGASCRCAVIAGEKTYNGLNYENDIYFTGECGIITMKTTGKNDIFLERTADGSN